ncbi:unnamed protein product [Schistocephalus solidus]|uniref:Protein yippee-like n=1 Tax=Schistocephalus solidus TaxID=70667 RepID=A0A183T608_SCHSO|nr:unnamed protein product [Schistocephalus solidus]
MLDSRCIYCNLFPPSASYQDRVKEAGGESGSGGWHGVNPRPGFHREPNSQLGAGTVNLCTVMLDSRCIYCTLFPPSASYQDRVKEAGGGSGSGGWQGVNPRQPVHREPDSQLGAWTVNSCTVMLDSRCIYCTLFPSPSRIRTGSKRLEGDRAHVVGEA